jgi:hypothetical protein
MSTAWENFVAATTLLASTGPMKNRLMNAFRNHLADLDDDELPYEIREEFSSLTARMSSVAPLRGETAVQATVRKMSELEAGRVATRIVGMMSVIAKLQTMQQRTPKLRAVNSLEA